MTSSKLEVNVKKATNGTYLKLVPGNRTTGNKNQSPDWESAELPRGAPGALGVLCRQASIRMLNTLGHSWLYFV